MGSSGVVFQFQHPTSVHRRHVRGTTAQRSALSLLTHSSSLQDFAIMATQQGRLQTLKSNSEGSFLGKKLQDCRHGHPIDH
jgi:hypothetical protein